MVRGEVFRLPSPPRGARGHEQRGARYVEQVTVDDPVLLGRSAGRLEPSELQAVDEALALVVGL